MYRKDSEKWLKHFDFIALDMICLQLAFMFAYAIRGYGMNVYGDVLYRNMAIFLGLADLVVIFMVGTMKSVLKRGHYKEFVSTLNQAVIVGALAIAYLFMIQEGQSFSRMILITTVVIYLFLTYIIRELWKKSLHKKMENGGDRKLLIVTSKEEADKVVKNMQENNYARFSLAGVVVIDADWLGKKICGVPVVANAEELPMYVCQEWIDEVLVVISEQLPYPEELIDKLTETGVTVHLNLAKITNKTGKRQFVEKVGEYTVLTTSLNYASAGQLLLKRLMDIFGGLVGCIATGIICLFVGPAIYIASPGPIFFSQERVGKNGKKFKMYKFRSMYMDAEERKAELMKENKLGDGKMFKMDFDPRVIGNKVLSDGTHKTGVGDFIRRTSLDEFPQFFNVLKGDMSIVGTRPPLISETNLYEPHHKATVDYVSGRNRYIGYLISLGVYSFRGVKVALDCANGSSWNIAKAVFDALGAKTYVINAQPDGTNINNNAGSTHIGGLQKYVVENGMDVGFAYDGDADRCLCVDEKGNVITGDHILYIYGKYMKERGKLLTNTVVTTVMSNFGLYKAFDELGIDYAKTAVGDKYVYEYMMKNGCRIGGEQSGHIIFSKYASTGDGILTSLKIMEVMMARKKKLSELSEGFTVYPQVLTNVRVTDKKAAQDDADVQAAVKKVTEELGDTGRILVRESGTEPVVRVMVEAESEEICQKYVDMVVNVIKENGYVAG